MIDYATWCAIRDGFAAGNPLKTCRSPTAVVIGNPGYLLPIPSFREALPYANLGSGDRSNPLILRNPSGRPPNSSCVLKA